MLDHVSLTVSDLALAEAFYDAVMAALGVAKVGVDTAEGWIGYGERCDADHPGRSYFSVRRGTVPEAAQFSSEEKHDGVDRSTPSCSGRHLCFKAPDRAAVEAFWRAGLARGGRDEGAPGLRPRYHASYYAAFLADPSGNRIEAVCHAAAGA